VLTYAAGVRRKERIAFHLTDTWFIAPRSVGLRRNIPRPLRFERKGATKSLIHRGVFDGGEGGLFNALKTREKLTAN